MKKLIIMNLILLVLYMYLPTGENINTNTEQIHTEVNRSEQILNSNEQLLNSTEQLVSSRSLIEPRKQVCEQVCEQVSDTEKATKYSEKLVEYIKQPNVEGFKEVAFIDKNDGDGLNQYTIGYGHHGSDVKSGQKISKEEADRLLRADLEGACEFVKKHCAYLGDLSQGELDALTDFTFNGGPGMLQKLTKNKTRTKEEIANHITSYTNGGLKGLVNRRNEELKMFLGGI